jgi:hypothetical protein
MKKVTCEQQIGHTTTNACAVCSRVITEQINFTLTPAQNPSGLASAMAAYFDGDIELDRRGNQPLTQSSPRNELSSVQR